MSYLNTWPLVWGFLNGQDRERFEFRFDLPAHCADALASGEADIGLVPCAELNRLKLDFLPELGIASSGPVRSILLFSKKPLREIRTLSADSSSRTSVALSRILLAERYGSTPEIRRQPPVLEQMLQECDAALIIGDPALRIDPGSLSYECVDLGAEWTEWSGLPMVFAVWAGRAEFLKREDVASAFSASYEWGLEHTEEIVKRARQDRGFAEDLARDYLTRHIEYRLSPRHLQGLELFRSLAQRLEIAQVMV